MGRWGRGWQLPFFLPDLETFDLARQSCAMGANPLKVAQYPAGFLPGVTDQRSRSDLLGPGMRERIRTALSRCRNNKTAAELKPYLDDAEALVEAAAAQIARQTGQPCGPIECDSLVSAALDRAYERYFFSKFGEDPSNRGLLDMILKLQERGRVSMQSAQTVAMQMARSNVREMVDPLADALRIVDALPAKPDK